MKLEFTLRLVCGQMLYYPTNALAETFTELLNRKCMKREMVAKFRTCGFTVTVTDERTNPPEVTEFPPIGVG